ncbi:MAG: hypothetical protein Q8K11_17015 [Phenylobacterium sp.]|uniref:DUF6886 family protein n=1 Tax=Phenylobacterium sp. TaxID=1871053 RepID=UPI002731D5B7|nr:DUF6886 family protein [Phenylobacterium sp.]MDP2011876.1 hypothetical protein [Phenylobacterium sp.]
MRLFHFSDDPGIECFVPRPVRVPSTRPPGRDWLNGPLVWAIDEVTQPLYFFPRDCPRIVLWEGPTTTEEDRARWFGSSDARMIAHVEWAWFERLRSEPLYRYELPVEGFEDLADAGMWVARHAVRPLSVETLDDLPAMMAAHGVELRLMASLVPLRDVWSTSLHASGVRLRHAQGWAATPDASTR